MATSFTGLDDYELTNIEVTERVLGHGSYADVLELKYMGLKCAGKRIHQLLLEEEGTKYVINRFAEECHLLSEVRHPNIVQFLGVHTPKGVSTPILVMESLPINLASCIDKYYFLPKEICFSILYDIALGLNYLHSRTPPIIHHDLSSNNILLTPNMTAKISDLGVAKMLNLTQQLAMIKNPGTIISFMPPEVNVANPEYKTSVDEFSYGIIIIHLLCRKWPVPQIGPTFTDPESGKLIPVSEADRRKEYIQMIGSDHPLMKLILKCLSNVPEKRAHASEMVEHLAPLVSDQLCQLDVLKCIEADQKTLRKEKQQTDIEISKRMEVLDQEFHKSEKTLQQLQEAHRAKKEDLQVQMEKFEAESRALLACKQSLTEKLKRQEERFSTTCQSLEAIQQSIKDLYMRETCTVKVQANIEIAVSKEEQGLPDPEKGCRQESTPMGKSLENFRSDRQEDSECRSETNLMGKDESESRSKRKWTDVIKDKLKGNFAQKQLVSYST